MMNCVLWHMNQNLKTMKSLKRISLVIVAVFALYACNNDFDEFQVKSGIDNNNLSQDVSKLNVESKLNKDEGGNSGSINDIIE